MCTSWEQVGDGAENGMDDEQPVDLGVALFIPYRYMEDRIFRAIQDAGFDDWTLAQARVFQRIAPDGSRLTELADQAQMSKQSAGVLVDQLERLGYVRRVLDPTDGRARLIVIEERGRRAAEVAMATSARDPVGVDGLPGHPQLHVAAPDFGSTPRDHRPLRAQTLAAPNRRPSIPVRPEDPGGGNISGRRTRLTSSSPVD